MVEKKVFDFSCGICKSDRQKPNPQIFLLHDNFFYFFEFLTVFQHTFFFKSAVPKSPNLTSHRFSIFQVWYVNRTSKNRIWKYFYNLSIVSIFFRFLKYFIRIYKVKYCLTGYTIITLMGFQHFQKFEKHRKNFWIEKILSDSVSAGPIYINHLKIPKSETKNVSVKIANV